MRESLSEDINRDFIAYQTGLIKEHLTCYEWSDTASLEDKIDAINDYLVAYKDHLLTWYRKSVPKEQDGDRNLYNRYEHEEFLVESKLRELDKFSMFDSSLGEFIEEGNELDDNVRKVTLNHFSNVVLPRMYGIEILGIKALQEVTEGQ